MVLNDVNIYIDQPGFIIDHAVSCFSLIFTFKLPGHSPKGDQEAIQVDLSSSCIYPNLEFKIYPNLKFKIYPNLKFKIYPNLKFRSEANLPRAVSTPRLNERQQPPRWNLPMISLPTNNCNHDNPADEQASRYKRGELWSCYHWTRKQPWYCKVLSSTC